MLIVELACSRLRVAHNVRVVKQVWMGLPFFGGPSLAHCCVNRLLFAN